jgi:hypothetical protein
MAIITAAALSVLGQVSGASAATSGVAAATPGELTAICDDLFADVYAPPSGEPLAASGRCSKSRDYGLIVVDVTRR